MLPVILSYDCIDHDPIDEWVPVDIFDVNFSMNFTIGTDLKAGDNFEVTIISPQNICSKNGRKYCIVVNEYSLKKVLLSVEKILEQCQDINWVAISEKLSKYMHWEYQDYK